jgi:hypothetical protein
VAGAWVGGGVAEACARGGMAVGTSEGIEVVAAFEGEQALNRATIIMIHGDIKYFRIYLILITA